ncbi:hypothetical protein BOTCAL_0087g00220 [Botryotinia calthae]|uniref:Uncharacterized protein n=1 Tax=Botryotinia calthae TaxID=38488 RepID=A0A4Y8D9I6_9HELO|nr:hypothetical protein BOTCAL_0087g00220 [Botryotinia calthae]
MPLSNIVVDIYETLTRPSNTVFIRSCVSTVVGVCSLQFSTSATVVKIWGLVPLPCTKALNSVVIDATNLGPLDDLEPFLFHVVQIYTTVGHPAHVSDYIIRREGRLGLIKYYLSPLELISIISFCLTIAMIALAAIKKDGVALLALPILSLQSSISRYYNWWQPDIKLEPGEISSLKSEIVIRTRNNAFIVVYCSEGAVKQLYMTPQNDYFSRHRANRETALVLKILALCLLSVSTIFLGNCQWQMQLAIGSSYAFLTLLLISIRAPSSRIRFWLKSTKRWPLGTTFAHKYNPELPELEREVNYMRTLWYAIKETRSIDWARCLESVPPNPMLEAWLAEAMENLDNDNWPALTEDARLVEGRESVYDLPVETTEVDESRREASLEITPIPESKW